MRLVLLLCCLCLIAVSPVRAQEWQSGLQQLQWEGSGPAPARWSVRVGDGPADIATLSQDGVDAGHLDLLVPDGGGWERLETGEDAVRWQARGADTLVTWALAPGADGHRLQLRIRVENTGARPLDSDAPMQLTLGPGLGETPITGLGIAETLYSYVQPVTWSDGELRRFDPEAADDWRVVGGPDGDRPDRGGLQSRYFALLLQSLEGRTGDWRVRTATPSTDAPVEPRYLPSLAVDLPLDGLAPGAEREWRFEVFAGPKTRSSLAAATPERQGYDELLFPGLWQWMRVLAFGLLWLLTALHSLIPSWGLAIIVLAILVRAAMYPIARRALRSQAAFAEVQQVIQPEMRRIKREYRGAEQSERILDLYREHGVSPLAGMKPLLIVLIQLPVFVALFHVLGQAWDLREAGFLWIDTLSQPDRLFSFGVTLPLLGSWFNLLPVLMAVTTLATIRLSPAPAADDRGRRLQTLLQVLMALAFMLLFYPFPAGMVLYWTMANVLHLLQQLVVERWSARKPLA
ncbi:MAG: membrane protein insertase YidC [Pseudomonadota bacterium]